MVTTVIISVVTSIVCTTLIVPMCKSLIGFARWEIKKSKKVHKKKDISTDNKPKNHDDLNGIIDEMSTGAVE